MNINEISEGDILESLNNTTSLYMVAEIVDRGFIRVQAVDRETGVISNYKYLSSISTFKKYTGDIKVTL